MDSLHRRRGVWCHGIDKCTVMSKYSVPVQRNDGKVVGHLPLRKSRKSADTIFHFLKTDKKYSWRINVLGKAVSAGHGLGMKVPCRLPLFEEEKYINVLNEKLSMLL